VVDIRGAHPIAPGGTVRSLIATLLSICIHGLLLGLDVSYNPAALPPVEKLSCSAKLTVPIPRALRLARFKSWEEGTKSPPDAMSCCRDASAGWQDAKAFGLVRKPSCKPFTLSGIGVAGL
jgi:hypothetical protein